MHDYMKQQFTEQFGYQPEMLASAPGRINLIGEHTDYNDGFVFPMAIDRRIWLAGKKRQDSLFHLVSLNGMSEITLDINTLKKQNQWSDYPAGIVSELLKVGHSITGVDAVVYGDVPTSSGLSSSAALLVSTLYLFMGLFELKINPVERAVLARKAEIDFIGLECGIMDQYISVLGKKDHALFIDCRTLDSNRIPLQLNNYVMAIMDTKKPRDLVESKYNERCHECAEGVKIIQEKGNKAVKALRDVSPGMLDAASADMSDPVLRRCRHVITENNRVLESIRLLKSNNLKGFGQLMNASHDSLRDDYEVSCGELDTLVNSARTTEGVMGARLTGAGFGGCAIALVNQNSLENFKKTVMTAYTEKFGYNPDIFTSKACDGAYFQALNKE